MKLFRCDISTDTLFPCQSESRVSSCKINNTAFKMTRSFHRANEDKQRGDGKVNFCEIPRPIKSCFVRKNFLEVSDLSITTVNPNIQLQTVTLTQRLASTWFMDIRHAPEKTKLR